MSTTARELRYHEAQVKILRTSQSFAESREDITYADGLRAESEQWHEVALGLDSAIHSHNLFISSLLES